MSRQRRRTERNQSVVRTAVGAGCYGLLESAFERDLTVATFRVSRRRREMYCGHPRLGVCVSVRGRMPTLLLGPGVTWGSGRGCLLVVHCWADLQSRHGLLCYGNITLTRNVSEYMLVFALCLVSFEIDGQANVSMFVMKMNRSHLSIFDEMSNFTNFISIVLM